MSTAKTLRVFLDSSVFFAASYSAKGSAHALVLSAIDGLVSVVLSGFVLAETERNILTSAPHVHPAFPRFRARLPHQLSNPSFELVVDTARVVVAKDAPIIAAARAANAEVVATYDRKHLLSQAAVIED